jgi:hypothetical protein
MELFSSKRFVFQQLTQQPNPETQTPPPVVDKTKEALQQTPDAPKEALPVSAQAVSDQYKDQGKKVTGHADANLTIFENLKVG